VDGACDVQITYEMVDKKMRELMMARGKKGVDKHEQVEALKYLQTVAKSKAQEAEVLVRTLAETPWNEASPTRTTLESRLIHRESCQGTSSVDEKTTTLWNGGNIR
jgi:hypothetical protein